MGKVARGIVIASEARQSSGKAARSADLDPHALDDAHWIATKPVAPRNDSMLLLSVLQSPQGAHRARGLLSQQYRLKFTARRCVSLC